MDILEELVAHLKRAKIRFIECRDDVEQSMQFDSTVQFDFRIFRFSRTWWDWLTKVVALLETELNTFSMGIAWNRVHREIRVQIVFALMENPTQAGEDQIIGKQRALHALLALMQELEDKYILGELKPRAFTLPLSVMEKSHLNEDERLLAAYNAAENIGLAIDNIVSTDDICASFYEAAGDLKRLINARNLFGG